MTKCPQCGGMVLREGDALADWELVWDEQHPELGQVLRNATDGSYCLICKCSEQYWGL